MILFQPHAAGSGTGKPMVMVTPDNLPARSWHEPEVPSEVRHSCRALPGGQECPPPGNGFGSHADFPRRLVGRKIPGCLSLRSTVRAGGECNSGVRHERRSWSGRSMDVSQNLRSEPALELKRLAGRTVPGAGAIRPSQPCRLTMRPPPMCRARGSARCRRCR